MKIFLKVFAALIASMVMVGCGSSTTTSSNEVSVLTDGTSAVDSVDEENSSNKIVFKVGEKPTLKQKKSVVNEVVSFEESNGVKLTSKDFLSHVQTVCLQIFVEGDYNPVYGKCTPKVEKKYPEIEVDYNKLPSENFKAKLVAYHTNGNYWKSSYSEATVASTNTKIFDNFYVGLGLQEVYMGDLHASNDVKLSMYIHDSTNETEFVNSNVYLFQEEGSKQNYESSSIYTDYSYARFWIQKDVTYNMLCLDDECYKLSPDFDFFVGDFDVSKMKKIEMIPVDSGAVCSIKYNQDYHQIIDMSPDKYNFEHYFQIDDCDQSRYKFQFKFTDLKGIEIKYDGRFDNVDGTYVEINPNSIYDSAWLYVKFLPVFDVEGTFFSPEVSVTVYDTYNNEIVQEETFELTTFEYINI